MGSPKLTLWTLLLLTIDTGPVRRAQPASMPASDPGAPLFCTTTLPLFDLQHVDHPLSLPNESDFADEIMGSAPEGC